MSNKIIVFSWLFLLSFFLWPSAALAGNAADQLSQADQSFEKQEYTQAMEQYKALYAEGYFTERMLYRMAFMYENLKNYPEAIFYLKKASLEYGNVDSDAKIRQMMQTNGSSRIFSSDGWDSYFLFFNRYGLIFWIAFGLLAAGLAASLLIPARKPNSLRIVAKVSGWTLFSILGIFFIHHLFFTPHRAVIISKTSYYDFPGYAGNSMPNIFSQGETVEVTDHQDIWARVAAGGREFWVPSRVLRDL
jgi:tetratricopeptide (TPR) repeat protein